jgi:hypothetical protein
MLTELGDGWNRRSRMDTRLVDTLISVDARWKP